MGGKGHEDFSGRVVSPMSDWATMHEDKSLLTLEVKAVYKCHDGSVALAFVNGKSQCDPDDWTKAKIYVSGIFETGDAKLRWMNGRVFVGKGRMDGNRIKINYYETC